VNAEDAQGRVNILVVDDSEDQRLLLRRYFERAGCIVVVAATAHEAIAAYGELLPDLAVIDLVLPGMDGWELTHRLHADHPELPIAITSVLDESDYPGNHAALPKPVSAADVRALLTRCVPHWAAA
jgi:CheY-like chemotaxis protein